MIIKIMVSGENIGMTTQAQVSNLGDNITALPEGQTQMRKYPVISFQRLKHKFAFFLETSTCSYYIILMNIND